VGSNMEDSVNKGLTRISEFINTLLYKSSWIFIGFIESSEKRVPIIISHFPEIDISIYSQRLNSEDKKQFLSLASLN
jgi:hypothetical protein